MTCTYCHKYKALRAPRTNCRTCWAMYFRANPGKAATMQTLLDAGLRSRIIEKMGDKYVRHYDRYRSTLGTSNV